MVTLDIKQAARESLRTQLSKSQIQETKVGLETLLEEFTAVVEPIVDVLPANLAPSDLVRKCVTACVKYAPLAQCSRKSLVMAFVQSVELGLAVDTPAGLAYILADQNKEARLLIGYQGYVQLGYDGGKIAKWELQVVHEKDVFLYEHGTNQFLRHTPAMKDRGEVTAVYSLVTLTNNEVTFLVFSRGDIERLRAVSGDPDGWAWVHYYDAMAKAKVAKHHAKSLPKAQGLQVAIGIDDQTEVGAGKADIAATWTLIEEKWAQKAQPKPAPKKRGAKTV